MDKYQKGKVVKGCVTGIEKYGAFVNLDNYYSGLIHISEISSRFVRDINDYVTIGETIYVKVLESIDDENHVKLSIKDIDYKINNKTYRKPRIKEVGTGFGILKENLDNWIEEIEKKLNL